MSLAEKVAPADAPIAFIDLAAQQRRIGDRIEAGIKRVLAHGGYIMGPEVKTFEADLMAFCGAKHAISCSNGTDAIAMVLRAMGIGPGDAVIVPSFTFASTAEVVAWLGATPVFADILPETYNIDVASAASAVETARRLGLKPRAIIPVDLFGQPADYAGVEKLAQEHGLFIIADAAQSFGASAHGRKVGTFGLATTTSFFPAKPLGCYGDGGAIFTDDDELAGVMRSIRVHGQGSDKYDNVRIGINGRLDTVQAAVLIEKLAIFADEIVARNKVADRYAAALKGHVSVPHVPAGYTSVWAQYTLKVDPARRDAIAAALKAKGIPTAVYYPKSLHQQTAYKHYPSAGNGLPVSERAALEVLSLPMHPYLDEATQDRIIAGVIETVRG